MLPISTKNPLIIGFLPFFDHKPEKGKTPQKKENEFSEVVLDIFSRSKNV
jgi:hypothetical protein